MLRLEDIRKAFKLGPATVQILKGVDLHVAKGEMLAIVGTSGCGKSTLMNILGFLDTPSRGVYYFEDQETSALKDKELSIIRNRKLGFVFQQFNLLPKLTALENVCLPLVYRGIREKERRAIARDMLSRVGMADRAHHKPMELSGGQQQRVAIARSLSGSPSLILADEPTGALDMRVGQEIMHLFKDLNQKEGNTIVIITHDPQIAAQCKRIVRMRDGLLYEDRAEYREVAP